MVFKVFLPLWSFPLSFWAGQGMDYIKIARICKKVICSCVSNCFYCPSRSKLAGRSGKPFEKLPFYIFLPVFVGFPKILSNSVYNLPYICQKLLETFFKVCAQSFFLFLWFKIGKSNFSKSVVFKYFWPAW